MGAADGAGEDRKRRLALLADPTIHASMRKVVRKRGVFRDQIDDVVHEAIADAMAHLDRLPLDPEEARLYLGGVARFKAIDHVTKRKEDNEGRTKSGRVDRIEPNAPRPEVAAHAQGLIERFLRIFPDTFEWFLRHRVDGETHREIAASVNRSPETVRQTVAAIGRAIAKSDGGRKGVMTVLLLLVFGIGLQHWRSSGGASTVNRSRLSQTAPSSSAPVVPPPPSAEPEPEPDATALRARARDECAQGQWDLCAQDLRNANGLDPAGETKDLADLLDRAEDRQEMQFAKPGDRPHPHRHEPGSGGHTRP